MASNPIDAFGLNLFTYDPAVQNNPLPEAQPRQTLQESPDDDITRTPGAQPGQTASYDPLQINAQGTNFTGQQAPQGQESGDQRFAGPGGPGGPGRCNYDIDEVRYAECRSTGGEWKADPCHVDGGYCTRGTDGGEIPGDCESGGGTPNPNTGECECPGGSWDPETKRCMKTASCGKNGCEGERPPISEVCGNGFCGQVQCVDVGDGCFQWQCIDRHTCTDAENPGGEATGGAGGSATTYVNVTGGSGGIPEDLLYLRRNLGDYLNRKFAQLPRDYEGNLTVEMPTQYRTAVASIDKAIRDLERAERGGRQSLEGLSRFDATEMTRRDTAQLDAPMQRALQGVQDISARSNLEELARTGGSVDTRGALDAIREAGMEQLRIQQAAERERFGQMGLAAGSDLAAAQSQGAALGMAQMIAQQQQLQAGIDQQRAQTRLQASGTLGNMNVAELGGLINALQTGAGVAMAPTQTALASAGVRQAGAAGLQQQNALMMQPYMQRAAMQFQIGEADRARQGQNINAMYQDWMRKQDPSPWLASTLAYATGFPPQQQRKPIIQGDQGVDWGQVGLTAMQYFMSGNKWV